MFDAYTFASALFDGGWTFDDKEMLIEEYSLSQNEAEKICEWLKEFETSQTNP